MVHNLIKSKKWVEKYFEFEKFSQIYVKSDKNALKFRLNMIYNNLFVTTRSNSSETSLNKDSVRGKILFKVGSFFKQVLAFLSREAILFE